MNSRTLAPETWVCLCPFNDLEGVKVKGIDSLPVLHDHGRYPYYLPCSFYYVLFIIILQIYGNLFNYILF